MDISRLEAPLLASVPNPIFFSSSAFFSRRNTSNHYFYRIVQDSSFRRRVKKLECQNKYPVVLFISKFYFHFISKPHARLADYLSSNMQTHDFAKCDTVLNTLTLAFALEGATVSACKPLHRLTSTLGVYCIRMISISLLAIHFRVLCLRRS